MRCGWPDGSRPWVRRSIRPTVTRRRPGPGSAWRCTRRPSPSRCAGASRGSALSTAWPTFLSGWWVQASGRSRPAVVTLLVSDSCRAPARQARGAGSADLSCSQCGHPGVAAAECVAGHLDRIRRLRPTRCGPAPSAGRAALFVPGALAGAVAVLGSDRDRLGHLRGGERPWPPAAGLGLGPRHP